VKDQKELASKHLRIALVGNPNIGKTSLFNKLCGLNQKTGNYPGVTIDKKRGHFNSNGHDVEVIDLPGINSLYPNSKDEELVVDYLLKPDSEDFPDAIVVVVSALNLKRNLYVFDQLDDLEIPLILAVNMNDLAAKRGIRIDEKNLSKSLGVPVIKVSARTGDGIDELKKSVFNLQLSNNRDLRFIEDDNRDLLHQFSKIIHSKNEYKSFLLLTQDFQILNTAQQHQQREDFITANSIPVRKWKVNESILRYKFIGEILKKAVVVEKENAIDFTTRVDKILLHKFWGYIIFLLILFSIFQSVFWLASYPMDWIDSGFSYLSGAFTDWMPDGYFSRLITEGVIPGIGGVVIFVPQIAILFLLFAILEESGYMPRIVFLMDRLMQRFGMSGKSIVPLISGFACAVPAIMSARTIENKKERLITILVTPLLTCSARIPVYVVVIALVVPDEMMGIFNMRGIALMALYLLGAVMAMVAAWVFNRFIKNEYKSYLILEMPEYLMPGVKNILISVWTSVKAFLWNAGKIIVATSIILFVLATNGMSDFKAADDYVTTNNPTASSRRKGSINRSPKIRNFFFRNDWTRH
jgi:ferrous iron transport protein B